MFFTYSPQLRRDIEDALSADRLTAYRNAADGDLERAIDLYVWNAGTGAAFFVAALSCAKQERRVCRRFCSDFARPV
jgi:hypothetical protein